MKLLAFVPIKLTLLLIIGILIGYYFPFDVRLALATTLLLFIGLGLVFKFQKKSTSLLFGLMMTLATISLGVFIIIQEQPRNQTAHYSKLTLSELSQWGLKIKEVLKPTPYSERYVATVRSVDGSFASGKILLSSVIDSSSNPLTVDDEIWLYSKISPIRKPLNPHQFDYKDYLEKLGIYHQLRLAPDHFFKSEKSSITIFGLATRTRNHIIKKLKRAHFGADELAVIQALLLGQRSDISEETYDDYKNAGAVHILAVSGLHIGVLLLLIQFLLRPLQYLPRGKTLILILSVLLLWGFAFLAGLSASIIRACTMFTFVAYALYLNRPGNTFNILALSLFFILLFINPNLLFQVGFQMSYAAVFAIVWIYPLFQKLWFPKNKVVRYVWQLLSVSIAAQLGVLPISLFYFHQFPGLFFISNLLIVPALGFILGTGIVVIVLSLIDFLPDWLASFFNELILLMNSIVKWVAQQEHFIFKSISFDSMQLALFCFAIIAFVHLCVHINFKRVLFFLTALLCFQSWTVYQEYSATQKKDVLVLHQTKNSILLNRNGKQLTALTKDSIKAKNPVKDFQIGERIKTIVYDTLGNSYKVDKELLLIIDSLGIYPTTQTKNTILLTYSPKLNLERLIETIRPKQIIADGSNYKSYTKRWETTCLKNKIPFHYTGEKGTYYFKSNIKTQ